jgi:hypothetical protein
MNEKPIKVKYERYYSFVLLVRGWRQFFVVTLPQKFNNNTMSDKAPKQLHWSEKRSKPVDRSKRVASGCKIDTTNIITGRTRKRKDFDYGHADISKKTGKIETAVRRSARESANIQEKREKKAKKVKSSTPKKRKAEDSEEEKPAKKQKTTPKKDEKSDEKKEESKTPVKSRKSTGGSSPLSAAIVTSIEKLGVKVPAISKAPRKYRTTHELPNSFDVFGRIAWPDGTVYMNKKLDLFGLEFVETDIAEASEYNFLRKNENYYIIADSGEYMLVALLDTKNPADPDVYIVDEKTEKGPHKLSTIFANLEVDTETEAQ